MIIKSEKYTISCNSPVSEVVQAFEANQKCEVIYIEDQDHQLVGEITYERLIASLAGNQTDLTQIMC